MYSVEHDALVIPAVDGDFVGDGRSTHGVFSEAQDTPLEHYSHIRGGVSWRNEKLQKQYIENNHTTRDLKGTWVFIGIYLQPFGHFLSESIHRLWYLIEHKSEIDGIIFISSVHQGNLTVDIVPNYVKKVLDYYASGLKIEFVNELTKIEKLIIPQPGSQLGNCSESWYLNFPDKYFMGHSLGKHVNSQHSKKIIVSRTRFFDRGRLLAIDYYWELLSKHGFEIINPEDYSLDLQVSIISNADVVIWEEGSAMHLLELFRCISSKQLLIARRPLSNGKYSLTSFLRRKSEDVSVFDSIVEVDSSSTPTHNQLSIISSPLDLKKFLEKSLNIALDNFLERDFFSYEYKSLKKLALSNNVTRDYLIDASYKLASIRVEE